MYDLDNKLYDYVMFCSKFLTVFYILCSFVILWQIDEKFFVNHRKFWQKDCKKDHIYIESVHGLSVLYAK